MPQQPDTAPARCSSADIRCAAKAPCPLPGFLSRRGVQKRKSEISDFFSFLPVFFVRLRCYTYWKGKNVFELHQTGKEDSVDADFLLIRKMKQGDDQAF